LLGPSASGKTTILRLLAGFESADHGRILVAGEDVTAVPPTCAGSAWCSSITRCFRISTLARMSALDCREGGKGDEGRVRQQITEALALVDLAGFERRKVHELSGGQQQRVALARALAPEPRVLLRTNRSRTSIRRCASGRGARCAR
jgi:ABC-type Fe3+/spermidine/putrescine transport system ATPase subunit